MLAVRYCFIQYILRYPPYLEAVSSLGNLRTRHAVVTRDPLNMVSLQQFFGILISRHSGVETRNKIVGRPNRVKEHYIIQWTWTGPKNKKIKKPYLLPTRPYFKSVLHTNALYWPRVSVKSPVARERPCFWINEHNEYKSRTCLAKRAWKQPISIT
jgi:hypothetical protein